MAADYRDQLQRAKERAAGYQNVVIPPLVRRDIEDKYFFRTTTIAKDMNGTVDVPATMRNEGARMAWIGLFRAIEEANRPMDDTPAAVSETAER